MRVTVDYILIFFVIVWTNDLIIDSFWFLFCASKPLVIAQSMSWNQNVLVIAENETEARFIRVRASMKNIYHLFWFRKILLVDEF